METWP